MTAGPARRALRAAGTAALGLSLVGCGLWRPTTVPMRMLAEPAACGTRADTLIVMLPGSFARPEEFVEEGFVAALRERRIRADVWAVDAHLGYYSEKSVIDRLQADVLTPAKAQGYAHVWLAGISIGAFGAMLAADAQPTGIDGVVILGPYLGSRIASNDIVRAGGLRQWTAPAGPLAPDDVDTRTWRWLKQFDGTAATAPTTSLYVGYGLDDRFRYSDDLLAAALPADRVFTAEGGHDWATWRTLWTRMLETLPLPRDASCAVAAG